MEGSQQSLCDSGLRIVVQGLSDGHAHPEEDRGQDGAEEPPDRPRDTPRPLSGG